MARAETEVRFTPGEAITRAPSALRVWSPSRRLAPSATLSALFQTNSAFRVLPSEPSPRDRSNMRCPHATPRLPLPLESKTADPKINNRRDSALGYRVLPFASPLPCAGGLARRDAGCSLGLSPSQGFHCRSWQTFRPASPHALGSPHGYPCNFALRLGVSIDRRLFRPRGSDCPLRVLHLGRPWHLIAPAPGYGFTSRSSGRCRPVRAAPWGTA
jgi:hypothetical protein